jgi:hypothetical protein
MEYLFASKEHGVFAPSGRVRVPPADVDAYNRELSAKEVEAFKRGKLKAIFAYWTQPKMGGVAERDAPPGTIKITTWMGDTLATVTWVGREYHPPAFGSFPSTRINFRAKGIDGRTWAGTYYKSSGSYVRMRPVKAQRRT